MDYTELLFFPTTLMAITVNHLELLVLHSENIEIDVCCWVSRPLPLAPVFPRTSCQMCLGG